MIWFVFYLYWQLFFGSPTLSPPSNQLAAMFSSRRQRTHIFWQHTTSTTTTIIYTYLHTYTNLFVKCIFIMISFSQCSDDLFHRLIRNRNLSVKDQKQNHSKLMCNILCLCVRFNTFVLRQTFTFQFGLILWCGTI